MEDFMEGEVKAFFINGTVVYQRLNENGEWYIDERTIEEIVNEGDADTLDFGAYNLNIESYHRHYPH